MKKNTHSISLIPYLESETKPFYLSLSSGYPNNHTDTPIFSPFSLVSEGGEFTRLFLADLRNDAGQSMMPLLLFTQRDFFFYEDDGLSCFNNILIENRWQDIFSYYSRNQAEAKPLILNGQISDSNALLPFQPLFYCWFKKAYFSPVCPYCGHPLCLCRDDRVLKENGLKAYSETLNRYMFCELCHQAGKRVDFYVSVKEKDAPGFLVDQAELIQKMGDAGDALNDKVPSIPCQVCSQKQACYGTENLALSRISVFSFYPFYMLIFNADQINSQVYKKMASGEFFNQFEEIADGEDNEDKSISDVLKRILTRWRVEMKAPSNFSTEAKPEHDLAATHIISRKAAAGIRTPEQAAPEDSREIPKTVIISKDQFEKTKGPGKKGEDLEKTHILRKDSANGDFKGDTEWGESEEEMQKRPPKPGTEIEKTVIITPGPTKAKGK